VILVAAALVCAASASDAEDAYRRAQEAAHAGDFPGAVRELTRAAQLEPSRPEFHFALAVACARVQDWQKARAAIQTCLRLRGEFPRASFLAGKIEAAVGNHAAAVSYLERARKAAPDDTAVLNALGLALAAAGKFADAAAAFRRIAALQPSAAAHYNLGLALLNQQQVEAAEKAFREALRLDPEHARAQIQLAYALLQQARETELSKIPAAVEAFNRAVRLRPDDPDLRFNLAYALARARDDPGAAAEYRELLRLRPDYPSGRFSLGFTLFRLGDVAEAETHFRAAMEAGQDDFALNYHLGSVLAGREAWAEAERHLERAVKLDPEQPGPHFHLARIYRVRGDAARAAAELELFQDLTAAQNARWRAHALERVAQEALSRGKLAEGADALLRAYKERPSAVLARNLALAYLQDEKPAEARLYLDKALELAPADAAAYNYLGLLEAREGRLDVAQKHFEMAARLDPRLADSRFNAGLAALECGETAVAVGHFQALLKREDTARVRQALALALSKSGRHEEARKQFEAAQKLER
jgi:Flp pilus assembly protein TadD